MANFSQLLFNRSWNLTVGGEDEEGLSFDTLHITFDIEKTSTSSPNKSKIDIYNLSAKSRKKLERKDLIIKLQAGYQNLNETLFLGNVTKITTTRKGPDIITSFECGDSEKQIMNAYYDQSYPPKTSYILIIKDLVKHFNLNLGSILIGDDKIYNGSFVTTGTVKNALDKLLGRQNLEWSIQNGYLQILPIKTHNGDEAVFLDSTTGLIGYPTYKESGVEFTSLLNPKIFPGCFVILNSKQIPGQFISPKPNQNTDENYFKVQGAFKVRTAKFEGDSHGEKWQVTCEAVYQPMTTAHLPKNLLTDFSKKT